MKKILLVALLCVSVSALYAQELSIDPNTDTWFAVNSWLNLSEKVRIKQEVHIRRSEFLGEWQQILLRPAVFYKLGESVSAAFGYTKVWNYPYSRSNDVIIPEDNLWQEIAVTQKFKKAKLTQSYRYELRWIGNVEANEITGRRFVNRLRYRVTYQHNLGDNGLFWKSYFELFTNITNNYRTVTFNQYWGYIGLGKKLSNKVNLQIGFMRQYLRRSSTSYEDNFTTRVNVGYTIF